MADAGFDKLSGKVKETTGKVTGDKELETEGKLEGLQGKVKDVADDVKGAVSGAVDHLKGDSEK